MIAEFNTGLHTHVRTFSIQQYSHKATSVCWPTNGLCLKAYVPDNFKNQYMSNFDSHIFKLLWTFGLSAKSAPRALIRSYVKFFRQLHFKFTNFDQYLPSIEYMRSHRTHSQEGFHAHERIRILIHIYMTI